MHEREKYASQPELKRLLKREKYASQPERMHEGKSMPLSLN